MAKFGIDLGTTYSCITKIDDYGNIQVIHNNQDASDELASAVYFQEGDNPPIVGAGAKEYMDTDPDRLVQFAKREIGKENGKTWNIDGKEWTPVGISSLILKRLKQIGEEQGETVQDVVITCPASFNITKRNETKEAGTEAGLNVLDLINEPSAAALYYSSSQFVGKQTFLVYDLGGGTFDITLLRASMDENDNRLIETLKTGGDPYLGGKDWDDALYNYVIDQLCTQAGKSESDLDTETCSQIRSQIEKAKIVLSNAEKTKIKANYDNEIYNIEVTRDQFENLTKELVEKTIEYVTALITPEDRKSIDCILLVGGSTFMPMIRNRLKNEFPDIQIKVEEPATAVSKGAALYSSIIGKFEDRSQLTPDPDPDPNPNPQGGNDNHGEVTTKDEGPGVKMENPLPTSFGCGVIHQDSGQYMCNNLLLINTMYEDDIPLVAVKQYGTVYDNQPSVRLRAFENTSSSEWVTPCSDIEGNPIDSQPEDMVVDLGYLDLPLEPNMPAGTPIEVTFRYCNAGLTIFGKNLTTGTIKNADLVFKGSKKMDPEIIHNTAVTGI